MAISRILNKPMCQSKAIFPLLVFCFALPILPGMTGCNSSRSRTPNSISRSVARAMQAMAQSTQLGALATSDTQYRERDPNPNPYVGELLFKRYCTPCHGAGKAPEILDNRVTQADAESDFYVIRYGLIEMKGFRSRLTTFQILDILSYMKVDLSSFTPGARDLSLKESSQNRTQTESISKEEDPVVQSPATKAH